MVLIAPLDWGLGHATRCIPVIKELLNHKCELWIAASGAQLALLQREFPFLPFVELPGYGIKYGKNRAFTFLKIIAAIPKILTRIKEEHRWLEEFLIRERPDAVISDNRYGLYSAEVYTVFITHQLRIRSSFGRIGDALLQWLNYRLINKFSSCWIPDMKAGAGLAGNLSHPEKMPHTPIRYIGILSRFEEGLPAGGEVMAGMATDGTTETGTTAAGGNRCDLLILLSGPEPQRTLFERVILEQLRAYPGRAILVRGLPGGGSAIPLWGKVAPGVEIHDHLPAVDLEQAMRGADLVLSRAGYSTVMDLARLGKRAVLVPTPGQTEQEYLGKYLADRRMALCVLQKDFSLSRALDAAAGFQFAEMAGENGDLLSGAIKDLVSRLVPAI